MQDRSIRSLARLHNSGSTSRLLNLLRLHQQNRDDRAHLERPFFRSALLNKAIIVKHRVRAHEREMFDDRRSVATKLILPIDGGDLRVGGRFAFVGQRGWHAILSNLIGDAAANEGDRKTLEVLDAIPSFDPFVLREHLRRADLAPAASYFDISAGDAKKMMDFLRAELEPLVGMSMQAPSRIAASTAAIAHKLMSNAAGEELEPLGRTLRLTPSQYAEGVFCWKGFLYYKWRLQQHAATTPQLIERIRTARGVGFGDSELRTYIAEAQDRIGGSILATTCKVADLLKIYDDAYAKLVAAEDPLAFRDFLLKAPELFVKLGDLLGAIDHVEGFWTYRFPPGQRAQAGLDELADIFMDFEESLGGPPEPQPQAPGMLLAC